MKNDPIGGAQSTATLEAARVLYRQLTEAVTDGLKRYQEMRELPDDLQKDVGKHVAALQKLLDIEVGLGQRAEKLSGPLKGSEVDLDTARTEITQRLARLHSIERD